MQHTWMRRMGILALVGGVYLTASGVGAPRATAAPPLKEGALDGITPNWDKVLPAAERFTILAAFGNAAVRDNETGLVWEIAPATSPASDWVGATANCVDKTIAGRKGWRLPSVVELASLVDPTQIGTKLPTGHPFTTALADIYWTATTYEPDRNIAWIVNFNTGSVSVALYKNGNGSFAWCVRGPMTADRY